MIFEWKSFCWIPLGSIFFFVFFLFSFLLVILPFGFVAWSWRVVAGASRPRLVEVEAEFSCLPMLTDSRFSREKCGECEGCFFWRGKPHVWMIQGNEKVLDVRGVFQCATGSRVSNAWGPSPWRAGLLCLVFLCFWSIIEVWEAWGTRWWQGFALLRKLCFSWRVTRCSMLNWHVEVNALSPDGLVVLTYLEYLGPKPVQVAFLKSC